MSPNYSLYSIPAYYVLTLVPHAYSTYLVRSRHNTKWDNANPRGKRFEESLKKSLPPACLMQYERCRAAHGNMFENMAFVVGAVLAGNIAGLESGYLNDMTSYYLVSRVIYLALYIKIERLKYSGLRTVIYIAGIAILFTVYFKAAGELASKGLGGE